MIKGIGILFCMIGFANLALADDSGWLVGDWGLGQQICSSGGMAATGFVPGRDRFETIYREDGSFTLIKQMNDCSTVTDGQYQVNDALLTLSADRSQSSCGAIDQGVFTYALSPADNGYELHIGPDGLGGACPAGDIMIDQFWPMQSAR